MPPVIGVTASWDMGQDKLVLNRRYLKAIEAAGGLPLILSYCREEKMMAKLVTLLDGLLFSGGVDMDPLYFGEEPLPGCGEISPPRDAFELGLAKRAFALGLPVLGICRGAQVLNIAAGGDVYQDLSSRGNLLKHSQVAPGWHPTHSIKIAEGTLLAGILGAGSLRVNSFHHQAVRRTGQGWIISAQSPDGVAEAVECPDLAFALGVQCHPELMWERYPHFLELFRALVRAASGFSKKP